MPLTDEQAQNVKNQLLEQVENFPEDKRAEIEEKILSMTNEELEEFLKQNQMMSENQGECIFCSIAKGKIPSLKIAENSGSIAILEINPLNKGHTIILPKEHYNEVPDSTKQLAKETSELLQKSLNPEKIITNETKIMEHALIELIPIYKNQKFEELKKTKADQNELVALQKTILESNQKEVPKSEQVKTPKIEQPEKKCIMCSIIEGKTPSYKIDENKNNLAILEINPISKGHSIVIPKKHTIVSKISSGTFTLAKRIAKKIQKKYSPIEIKISSSQISGHAIVEIIPLYGDEKERRKASPEELQKIQSELEKKPRQKKEKQSKPRKSKTKVQKRKFPDLPLIKPRIPR